MRSLLTSEVAWWISAIVPIVGVLACVLYIRRTWWAALLMIGFAIEVIVSTFYRASTGTPRDQILGLDRYEAIRLVSHLSLAGKILLVLGVWGLLAEAGRRVSAGGSSGPRRRA